MKNVTITLPDDLAARARLAAAQDGTSLSKFVAGLLNRALGGHADPLSPFDRWLAGPGWDADGAPTPQREDIHDRTVLRGYERPDLPARPQPGSPASPDAP